MPVAAQETLDEILGDNPPISNDTITDEEGEFSAFDLFVGGKYYDFVYGTFGDGWFQFDMASDVPPLIPFLSENDYERLTPLFEGRVVGSRTLPNIGTVEVKTDTFRIEVTLDRSFGSISEVELLAELPPPPDAFFIRNKFNAKGNVPLDQSFDDNTLTYTHDTIAGRGKTRLRSQGSLSDAAGYEVTGALIEHDFQYEKQDLTASGGMIQSKGSLFAQSLDLFGLKVETNSTLFSRDDLAQATKIELFLSTRSRVEIFRDSEANGRTLYSKIHDFGTVEIDTRGFPTGSYNVEIVIERSTGQIDRETRPFVKSRSLALRDKPELSLTVGMTRDDLDSTDAPVIEASYRQRLTTSIDGEFTLVATESDAVFESGFNSEYDAARMGFIGLITTRLSAAIDKDGKLAGVSGSAAWSHDSLSATVSGTKAFNRSSGNASDPGFLELSKRSSLNFALSSPLPYFVHHAPRLSLSGEWSSSGTNRDEKYRIGPKLTFKPFPDWFIDNEVNVQYLTTEDDDKILAKLVMRHGKHAWSQTANMDYLSDDTDSKITTQTGIAYNGNASKYVGWQRNLKVNAGLRMNPLWSENEDHEGLVNASATYEGKWAQTDLQFDKSLNEESGSISGDVTSTVLWSSDGYLHATGKKTSGSTALALITINGEQAGETVFAVKMNGGTKAYAKPGETVLVNIPVYKTSTIEVVPEVEEDLVSVQNSQRSVTAYPGNIFKERFDVVSVSIVFGRMVLKETGEAISNKRFETPVGIIYTDMDGYIQMDASIVNGEVYEIQNDIHSCRFTPGNFSPDEYIYEAGDVLCELK